MEEYIDAPSLEKEIKAGRRFTASECESILKNVAKILQKLSEHIPPIIHRDIKPANLLIDKSSNVYLVDFGVVAKTNQTLSTTFAGTAGYVSPEQIYGKTTPASDIYSLGATILHLVSHVAPCDMQLNGITPDFDKYIPKSVPSWLSKTIKIMMSINPSERPQTGGELIAWIDRVKSERSQSESHTNAQIHALATTDDGQSSSPGTCTENTECTTNEDTTSNNNTPSNNETTPDLPDAPPIYIKLDWGTIETTYRTDKMTYIYNTSYSRSGLDGVHDNLWDVRFTIYYIGKTQSKTIKYINLIIQALDRVDEPIGEPHETRFTGPLEPKNYSIYDHKRFWEGREYSTLGYAKLVKLIITYMDKTVDEITNEDTLKAICISPEKLKLALPKIKEPIKLNPPTEPPIYIHFNSDDFDIVYIGNNESKAISFISIQVSFFNPIHIYKALTLKPKNKLDKVSSYCRRGEDISVFIELISRIDITYEDNTYIEIPKRMIKTMTSDENYYKADLELTRILREAEEAKRTKMKDRIQECCLKIDKFARKFWKTPNDKNATSLLNVLNEYCPNKEVMAANYLTKERVAKFCGDALHVLAFDTIIIQVTQKNREDAKSFLALIAPERNSEMSFNKFVNDSIEAEYQSIKKCASAFLETPNDHNAVSLLNQLDEFCPNDVKMADNWLISKIVQDWLTMEHLSSACSRALQKMAYDTNNDVIQVYREDAKSFLARIAPELNSMESYKRSVRCMICNLEIGDNMDICPFCNTPVGQVEPLAPMNVISTNSKITNKNNNSKDSKITITPDKILIGSTIIALIIVTILSLIYICIV